ncbi:hypothetical protein [Actinomadura roseirufa]|uniref:hypothetical protein n=1 Tax=Actinomadura roseirufa TaxID=2094049 RepID=UPI001A955826|nr:hypothetical protein [Actinomadura roseirufa]
MDGVRDPGEGAWGGSAGGAAGPRADPRSGPGAWGAPVPDVTGRPVWRLLLRGLAIYLPGWETPSGAVPVSAVPGGAAPGFGPPAFLDGGAGFGLQVPERRRGLEPDREIYVRGRENPSFGIVVAGPAAAVGSRLVTAAALMRFARRLTFEELYDTADADSVPYAVRGARAVENVVFLDRAAGAGLCVEVEPVTRAVRCPLYMRLGGPAERSVRVYGTDGAHPDDAYPGGASTGAYAVEAQAVRSHS